MIRLLSFGRSSFISQLQKVVYYFTLGLIWIKNGSFVEVKNIKILGMKKDAQISA